MLKIIAVLALAAGPAFSQGDQAAGTSDGGMGAAGAASSVQNEIGGQLPAQNLDFNGVGINNPLGQGIGNVPSVQSPAIPRPASQARSAMQTAPSQPVSAQPSAVSQGPSEPSAAGAAPALSATQQDAAPQSPGVAGAVVKPFANSRIGSPRAGSRVRAAADQDLTLAAQGVAQARSSGAGPGAMLAVLNRVFEAEKPSAARRFAGSRTAGSTPQEEVQGRFGQTRENIAYLISQAASSPAGQQPALYEAALDKTADAASSQEKILSPRAAKTLAAAILRGAVGSARSALPDLADKAYAAAAQNNQEKLDEILGVGRNDGESDWTQTSKPGSLDAWQRLLTQAGRPIRNLDDLKNDVKRVQDEARAFAPGNRPAAPKILFAIRNGGFAAIVPLSAVPQSAFASFALPQSISAAMPSLPAPIVFGAEKNNSSPRTFAAYLRRHGVGFLERARFWTSYFIEWLRYEIFRIETRLFGPGVPPRAAAVEIPSVLADLNLHAARADALMPKSGQAMSVRNALAFLAEAQAAAQDYERATGDESAGFIVSGFARKIKARSLGLSLDSQTPDYLEDLIEPEQKDTLSHWVERFRDLAAERAPFPK